MSASGQWCVTKDRHGGFSAHMLSDVLRDVNAAVLRGKEPDREVVAVVDSLNQALQYRRQLVRAMIQNNAGVTCEDAKK